MRTQPSERDIIKAHQRAWATRNKRTFDAEGYCRCVDDNIFQGLSVGARKDFESGDGTELGKNGERGKIQALHSSSALACNWFDYWRGRDLQPLSRAFGVPLQSSTLTLEHKLRTGLGGIGPNLDVLLCGEGTAFAIESKFTEPYTKSNGKTWLKPKYFSDGRSLWTEKSLAGCQAVAEALRTEQHVFRVLDVAQLLKHMLGLAFEFGRHWSLCCLWFEVPGSLADQHRQELRNFTAQIGKDGPNFLALTYQELFASMLPFVGQADAGYIEYLRDRYLSEAVGS